MVKMSSERKKNTWGENPQTKEDNGGTRKGEPMALVTPPPLPKSKLWLDSLRDTVKITGDIISPALNKKDLEVL